MKFTKEQVVENIKNHLGKTQKISDKTISDIVTNAMAFVDDETELTAFLPKVIAMVETTNVNFNHDQGKFIKDYEKENPRKKNEDEDEDEDKKGKGKKKGDDEPEWHKAEVARRQQWEKEQEAKLEAIKSEDRAKQLRTAVLTKFREDYKEELARNPILSNLMENSYADTLATVGTDDDETTLAAKLTAKFTGYKTSLGDSYIPSDGNGGGGSGQKKGADDPAVRAALEAEGVKLPVEQTGDDVE